MRAVHRIFDRPQISASSSWQPVSRQRPSFHAQPPGNPTHAIAARSEHDFGRVGVTAAPPGSFQARLTIGHPGDRFEREADLIADRVMQTPRANGAPRAEQTRESPGSSSDPASAESIRRAPEESANATQAGELDRGAPQADPDAAAPGGGDESAAHDTEQLAVMLLEEDDLEGNQGSQTPAETSGGNTVQAREIPGQTPAVSSRDEAAVNALRGGGSPLASASRAFFEPRFGHDFGNVRIHTGTDASRIASAFGARAFTIGRDVVFGAGQYQPATPSGGWLMAHELAHVLQQREGSKQVSAASIPVQHTMHDRVQGGFFSSLWSGIKKGASAVAGAVKWTAGKVWQGIKWTAGKAWQGIKWTAGKVWKGAKAVGRWGWDVLKSAAALAWRYIVNTPGRVWRLIKHLGSGIAGVASALWQGLKIAFKLDFKGLGKLLLDGLLSGTAWVLRLVAKLADVAGIGEIWDLLSQIIKVNTRTLNSVEQGEAKKVFRNSISYWQVRIDEHSLISKIGAWFKGSSGMGVTTFHTVNFNHKINATAGSLDMRWLAHELTHVSQYEHAGAQYLGEAVHAQATAGYDYHGPTALWRPSTHVSPNTLGRHFREFNREQQADIAADYYYSLYNAVQPTHGFALVTTDYEPVIDELRDGKM